MASTRVKARFGLELWLEFRLWFRNRVRIWFKIRVVISVRPRSCVMVLIILY
jgi:hypothetical protein